MPKRAAIYTRMSTQDQENSPDRQLSQTTPYCQRKGYTVVGHYQDLAMRGSDDGRPDFLRLLKDAAAGKFDVVVVDEQSRLTRTDTLEYFVLVAYPLKMAGVTLDTVAKGVQDWVDLAGIIMQTVDQHSANAEVVTLSRRVSTEVARKALRGEVYAGKPPYGYSPIWLNNEGQVVHRGKKTWEKVRSDVRPSVEVNDAEAETVRWIFRAYVEDDLSLNGIVLDLAARSVPSPRGLPHWNRANVRQILTNPAYVGDYIFNRATFGRFHKLSFPGGSPTVVLKKGGNKAKAVPNPEEEWVVIPDHHPPVIPRELFRLAQEALRKNRERRAPAPRRGDYALSKLLVCGHCGSWMTGARQPNKVYFCSGAVSKGKDFCKPYRVPEDVAVSLVLSILADYFLSPSNLQALREAARASEREQKKEGGADRLRKELAGVEARIKKATANILLLDADLVPQAQTQLRQWEKERQKLAADLQAMTNASPVEDTERQIAAIEGRLAEMREGQRQGSPQRVRKAARASLARVSLRFHAIPKKRLTRYRLAGGSAEFLGGDRYDFVLGTDP